MSTPDNIARLSVYRTLSFDGRIEGSQNEQYGSKLCTVNLTIKISGSEYPDDFDPTNRQTYQAGLPFADS